jgi:adenine phosphoribosyltransferase
MFESIKERLCKMPLYKTENGYEYFVYPYKGITPIDSREVQYLAEIINSKISKDVDLIFTVETDGIFTALPVALLSEKPIVVARTFNYKMTDFFQFTQETGYYKRELFFSLDLNKIKKVAILDCVLSTGGTLKAVTDLFRKIGVEVEGIYVVINKINYSNKEFLNQINDRLFAIFDAEIKGNSIIINKSKYYK